MNKDIRIALTGFMGVGKSSVARHLAHMIKSRRLDLDHFIENQENRRIAEIINDDGIDQYRVLESKYLKLALDEDHTRILSLGGGTWTIPANRETLKTSGYTTVWLESPFEHCWLNISFSRKDRPLARNKADAIKLFEERQKVYCLADWHFVVRADHTSFDVAKQIADEIFS